MSWTNAAIRGVAIFAYFFIATVWLPDLVLTLGPIASASGMIQDIVGLSAWGLGLGAGMFGLRLAQRRGLI